MEGSKRCGGVMSRMSGFDATGQQWSEALPVRSHVEVRLFCAVAPAVLFLFTLYAEPFQINGAQEPIHNLLMWLAWHVCQAFLTFLKQYSYTGAS